MNEKLLLIIQDLINSGVRDSEIRKFIREEAGLKKTQGNTVFNQIKNGKYKLPKVQDDNGSITPDEYGILTFEKSYVYNSQDDKYITFLEGKNIVTTGAQHRAMMRDYINDVPVDQIAIKYSFPTHLIPAYKKAFGWARGGVPITDEEIENNPVEKCAQKMLEEKKFDVQQSFHKLSWKTTVEEAKKWQEFKYAQFDPFVSFLEKWNPPGYKSVNLDKVVKKGDKHFVASLADIHVGLISHSRYNFFKDGWSHEELEKSIKSYVNQIREEIQDRKTGFKSAYLLLAGDICHTLTGFTDKGTKLEYEFLAENQFDLAFNVLVYFINELLTIFPTIQIKTVQGNHSSFGDYVVAKVLQSYYRTEDRLEFEITTKRYLPFRIENTLVILEHGYSAFYKSRLPKSGPSRENYVNNLFLSKPELLNGITSRLFISADQHHVESKEYNQFEHIMLSTMVGADRHSDNCGYVNRPRQTCIIVGESGVQGFLYFYFDGV